MNLTEKIIARLLVVKHWRFFKEYCIPNTYYMGWESDLLVINSQGYLEEVEIKISLSDFKADFTNKKDKHKRISLDKTKLHKFWYCVPFELKDKVIDLIPKYAGLLYISRANNVCIAKNAPTLKNGVILQDADKVKLLRLAYIRIWDNKN